MTPKPQHLAVYLGDNQYQCAKCGLIASRAEVVAGWPKPCVVTEVQDLAVILDRVSAKLEQVEANLGADLTAIYAEIAKLKEAK